MSLATEHQVEHWDDFASRVAVWEASANAFLPGYFFRGQPSAAWGLLPSFARECRELELARARSLERAAIREFQRHASIHLEPSFTRHPADRLSWLAIMQHYGCPTRLLDWTGSPYVALYFAACARPESDGAVWCARGRAVQDYAESRGMKVPTTLEEQNTLLDANRQAVIFVRPLVVTDRMSVQQTFFTVSGSPLADHEQTLAAATPGPLREHGFMKLIIPSRLKLDCLRHLRRMNVTAQALFPGIDGLGASIGEAIRMEAYGLLEVVRRGEVFGSSRDIATGIVRRVEPQEIEEQAREVLFTLTPEPEQPAVPPPPPSTDGPPLAPAPIVRGSARRRGRGRRGGPPARS